jgi:glycosyltransferase involved in cell wall biosynthesis
MFKITKIVPLPFFVDRGGPVRVYEEARALQKRGCHITIYTYHLGRNIGDMDVIRIPTVPWYNITSVSANYHKIYLDALLFGTCLIHPHESDIIHAHLHEGAAIGSALRWFKKKPLVFDVQGSLTSEMVTRNFIRKNSFTYKIWEQIEHFIDNHSNALIVNTTENANILINEFGVQKEKVFVVSDAVDTTRFRPDISVSDLRERMNLSGKKVVVYLGLLTKYQGLDYLLNCIPAVVNEIDNIHFLIMGYPNIDYYKSMAKELGVLDKVTFTGKMDYSEAPKYLAVGDIAVSPKIMESREGNGKIYNYMASGLPTVVFDHPVNREILGDLGIYAKEVNSASFADAIINIMRDDEQKSRISSKVREKAVKDYSWDDVAQKIMGVYRWVME